MTPNLDKAHRCAAATLAALASGDPGPAFDGVGTTLTILITCLDAIRAAGAGPLDLAALDRAVGKIINTETQ